MLTENKVLQAEINWLYTQRRKMFQGSQNLAQEVERLKGQNGKHNTLIRALEDRNHSLRRENDQYEKQLDEIQTAVHGYGPHP